MADPAPAAVTAPHLFSTAPGPAGESALSLNKAEQARAAAMADDQRRATYESARMLWRQGARAFTQALGMECPDFSQLPAHGAITPHDGAFCSSLCHTDSLVLVAFSKGAIGVDAEPVTRTPPWEALARRWFTTSETDWLRHQNQPRDAFLTLWTLKEAWIKATGRGIAGNLQALFFSPERNRLVLDQPDPSWCVATTTSQSHRIGVIWQGGAAPEWWHDGNACNVHWHRLEVDEP
ncbi:4'-phosphopantetheinyl transferase family protein [Halomonadaceae bacterium KBTZ08]